jgi:hypothetical protein
MSGLERRSDSAGVGCSYEAAWIQPLCCARWRLGAPVSTRLAEAKLDGLAAIHLNFPIFIPPPLEGTPTEEEKAAIARAKHFFHQLSGYSNIQKTRPQTIGSCLDLRPLHHVHREQQSSGAGPDQG